MARKPGSIRARAVRRLLAGALACGAFVLGPVAAPASAGTATLSFTPEADTYVDSTTPTTSYGSSTGLWVDGGPQKHGFLRFRVSGLAGRTVTKARLRLYQRDASPLGGRVFSISSNSWSESITWNTRPAIDGPQRGSFGAVQASSYYEADLGAFIASDGPVSVAVDSTSDDGVRWGSREYSAPPQLLLDVADTPADGLTQIADRNAGSSDPTYLPTSHRLAVTAGGRLLTVWGRHASGIELSWRDPSAAWQDKTTGTTLDGTLLSGTKTGDWPASIALARDSSGVEHAWVVWARNTHTSLRPVQMARLSDLDAPGGPRVGPVQTVDAPSMGAYKADLAFERTPGGGVRGALVWGRRSGDTTYDLVTGWFTDLDSDAPVIHDKTVVHASDSSSRHGTLVPTSAGMRLVARGVSGRLNVFTHAAGAALGAWSTGATGIGISGGLPSATALDSGEVLAAIESDTTSHTVTVQRFSPSGVPAAAELRLSGYAQPTIATDGANAWIVMVRQSDGYVVSRQLVPGSGWSSTDRVEVGAEGGGNLAWPNAVRSTDGRLRFVLRGPVGDTAVQSAVLGYQRAL